MIALWKGKKPIYFGVIRLKVTITINIIFDNRVVSTWLFLRSTALLLHAHKNTVFYRYIIEAGKTVADV
jgi:hypothetical protein